MDILKVLFFLLLISCGAKSKDIESSRDFPNPIDVSEFTHRYNEIVNRLKSEFIDQGYVVSRNPDNSAQHIGDAAKYTGLALASMPCNYAKDLFYVLTNSILENNGLIVRHASKPNGSHGLSSRDQQLGVAFGLMQYWINCSQESLIKIAWQKHYDFIKSNDYQVDPPNDKLNTGAQWFFHKLSLRLLVGSDRPDYQKATFEGNLIANAEGAQSIKSPCYPVDLSMLQIMAASKLGNRISNYAKSKFCAATKDMKLEHADIYCFRSDGREFLRNFKLDTMEYRLQRCPYETEDNEIGFRSPGVDFILIYSLLKGDLT